MSPFLAKVDRVIDGDTIWARIRIRTRQSAPPAGTEDGKQATAALKKALPVGTDIEVAPIITDQFGRVLATITRFERPA